MAELKKTFYQLFDDSQTVQRFIEQTEANNDESINKTVNKIIDHASGALNEDVDKVNDTTQKVLKSVTDDYLSEDFVHKYVQGSVKNQ